MSALAYRNGNLAYDATMPVDQQAVRLKLRALATAARPGEDLLAARLRPESAHRDALARARMILSLRHPSEEQLWDCRFALEFLGQRHLAHQVYQASVAMTSGVEISDLLDPLRRALAQGWPEDGE